MNYEEDKIARKEYETVKVGKSNYTYDDFLKEYYPADYKAQQRTKNKVGNMQFVPKPAPVIRPAPSKQSKPVIRPAPSKQPAVQIETPKKEPTQIMSAEERIAEGLAGQPMHIELKKDHLQLKSEEERKSQIVINQNYKEKEDAYYAQVQKTQEENRQKEMEAQKQREQNARSAAISMYPFDPEMQKWGQNFLMEQGFKQSVEEADLNAVKKQIDHVYELHTTGKRQEAKHAEVAEEHKRKTAEAAEQKRKAEEEEARRQEAEAQRRTALEQKYDEKAPSVRMAERLLQSPEELMKILPELEKEFPGIKKHFPELIDRHPEFASRIAEELQAQNYDGYIRSNYIDIDDETQWDSKSVSDMRQHLHGIFRKIAYEEFEEAYEEAIQNGTLPELNGQLYAPKIIVDSDNIANQGALGLVGLMTKREHNDYAAEKLANSATTAGEAYVNQLTEGARQVEGVIDNWREKLFGRDDLFNARQVEEAEKARAVRAETEHPMATAAGKLTVELIKSAAGKAFPLEEVLPLAGKAGQAIVKMLDAMSPTVRRVAEEAILSAPEAFLEGAYEGKSIEEILKDVAVDTTEGVASEAVADNLIGDSLGWLSEAVINSELDYIKDQQPTEQNQTSYLEPLLHQDIVQAEKAVEQQFPDIPKDYLLEFTGGLRKQMEQLTESPYFQTLDERTKQKKIEQIEANVLEQFWEYYRRQMGY